MTLTWPPQLSRRTLTTMQWAVMISLAVHASLLLLRIAAPATFERLFEEAPLEVVLVNARSQQSTDQAKVIAQVNLAGGGEHAKGRATSPLPPALASRAGDSLNPDESKVASMREEQNRLLAQVKRQIAQLKPLTAQEAENPQAKEREKRRQALIHVLAEIEKRIQEDNERPRRRYISPATQEAVYAIYYDAMRRKIEQQGTQYFPESGGRKLYGELTMGITVNASGEILAIELLRPSGLAALDRQAQALVRQLRFDPFDSNMLKKADQIVVISRFQFRRNNTMQTQMLSQ